MVNSPLIRPYFVGGGGIGGGTLDPHEVHFLMNFPLALFNHIPNKPPCVFQAVPPTWRIIPFSK